MLIGASALQHWLWIRIGSPATDFELVNPNVLDRVRDLVLNAYEQHARVSSVQAVS